MGHRRWRRGVIVATLFVLVISGGCKSSKKSAPDLPKTISSTVTASPPAADKIEYIEVRPWAADPGGTVEVLAGGTPGRNGTVTFTGLSGAATGKTLSKALTEGKPGQYSARLPIDDSLPAGTYRVEVELSGTNAGQPTKLASSRAFSVSAPPPPADVCAQARATFEAQPIASFEFNRDELSPEALQAIAAAAEQLRAMGSKVAKVTIEGHCDERGSVEYNLALGGRRAGAVKRALAAALGAGGPALTTISYGEERPVVRGAQSEADHARNRRAVLQLDCAGQH